MRVATYIRVSTDRQAHEGDSLAAQREALARYIKDHPDYVHVGEYMDDGISGQKWTQRSELQRLLSDVEAGQIDLVVCTKLDRLHRSLKNFLTMQEIFDAHGVRWIAIHEPMYDTTTPAGQLIINQMMSFAQFEAQNTGQRIRAVQDYRVQQGQVITGSTPPGYSIVDKRLVPNEDAPNVSEAFAYFAESGSLSRTIRHCASLPGLPRTCSPFKGMLTNRMYIGEYRGNPAYCPPIIDRALFDDVQRKLTINVKVSATRVYIFAGLLYCGECGARMTGFHANDRLKAGVQIAKSYRCARHYRPVPTCDNAKTIRESVLERDLLARVQDEARAYVVQCEADAAPARDYKRQKEALERKIQRLKELYINELITIDEYKADKKAFEDQIAELESSTQPSEPVDTSHLAALLETDFAGAYHGMTEEQRRYFWRAILARITLDGKKTVRIYFA